MQQEIEPEAPRVPLSHYLWILRRHLWKIVAFVVTCVIATFVISARQQRIYESTATIVVDWSAPTDVVGEGPTSSVTPFDPDEADEFLATQIRLIQSDAVLRPVIEQNNLLNHGEQIKSGDSAKTQQVIAAPVTMGGLKVTRPSGTYLLLISYQSTDPQRAADLANAVANSYILQTYNLRIQSSAGLSSFMEKQLDELRARMERSSLALAQFEKDLDVINPDQKTNILSARLQQLNGDYTTAQADRIRSEAAWNAVKAGSLEAAEASSQGNQLAALTDTLNRARQRFALVKATYGTTHPEYRKAASELAEIEKQFDDTRRSIADRAEAQYKESLNREQMLEAAVDETKAEWDRLNARSFEYQRFKQEADTDKALYDELTKKIREADINAGFRNNNLRIADYARPSPAAVSPNIRRNLILAFLISALLAIGLAILLDSLDTTLRDPAEASRFLGTDVIATMPSDRTAAQLPQPAAAVAAGAKGEVVPKASNGDRRGGYYQSGSGFDEAVRTLRNTILLSDFEGRLRSLVITSADQGEGKSTLSAHLAIANVDRGKKVLLVDGDLRRPSLHSKFSLTPNQGLSSVLMGELPWQEAIIQIEGKPNLSFLPAGPGSHRAADLIGPRLATLLDEFAKEFDLVILDSPPLLGFAECLQMAVAADGVLIVARAGQTKRRAVAEVVSVLRRLRANIVGVVLNQVKHDTSAGGYSHYGYNRYYSDRDPEQTHADS
jgi:capsular exopolysaccharide synthesis family protein